MRVFRDFSLFLVLNIFLVLLFISYMEFEVLSEVNFISNLNIYFAPQKIWFGLHDGNAFYWIFSVLFISFYLLFLYRICRRFKPRWRVKVATKVLTKIRSFEGSGKEKRILSYLKQIDPFVFEEMLLTCFKERGCRIKRNRRYTGDGGIDGKVTINSKKFLIQAKRYKNYIQKAHVVEFVELCRKKRRNGLFIHTGKTGKGSVDVFDDNSKKICMISDDELVALILGAPIKVLGINLKSS